MEINKIDHVHTKSQSSRKNNSGVSNNITPFTTINYVSKNDGQNYTAKPMTISDKDGKSVEGVYVYLTNAKPDKNGKIQGEFMSKETFLKKMYSELPSINSDLVKSYNSNIKTTSTNDKFDMMYEAGCELSDGSVLLRPTILNTGSTQIVPSKEKGYYDVIFTSYVGGYKHEPTIRTISEEELLSDKWLCAGTIKENEDGEYEISYLNPMNSEDKQEAFVTDKEGCIEFMKEKHLHF